MGNRLILALFTCASLLCAFRPLGSAGSQARSEASSEVVWPTAWAGSRLERIPLTDREAAWVRGFPGQIARFRMESGEELVIRATSRSTRMLHPSRHCYQGIGHSIRPIPAWRDQEGRTWSRFIATSPDGGRTEVRELVLTEDGARAWSDVESWYWSALSAPDAGPWRAVTWSMPQGAD